MAELTEEQRDFLKRYKIPLSEVFDASGYGSRASWQARMKELGKSYAFGTRPCDKAAHTLRKHSGHCLQCDPKKINFRKRFQEGGYVYIAQSSSTKLIKVGTTTELDRREKDINFERYGGASDWRILAAVRTERAGEIESKTHNALEARSIQASYFKGGDKIDCRELFDCTFDHAKQALLRNLPKGTKLQLGG